MTVACPLCRGTDLAYCMERERVPVFQNIGHDTINQALMAPVGRLQIIHCNDCGFVFNGAFDSNLAVYSSRYENDQTLSAAFRDHLDQIAERVIASLPRGGKPLVLEVGCGQGHFLKRLASAPGATFNQFVGFDPAWRGDDDGMLDIKPRLFNAAAMATLASPIGAVVSRHVIEHVPDPIGFLSDIRVGMETGGGWRLMIETPCLEWIVRNEVIFDFFYEHCSYFTRDALAFALRRAGYRVHAVERVFQGQYLWAEAEREDGPQGEFEPLRPIHLADGIARLARLSADRLTTLRSEVASYRARGRVALWGAGAKGATLAALVDPDAMLLDSLIDINPRKQGTYLAMTAHPIVSPRYAAVRGVRTVLLLNPNYRAEVHRMIGDEGLPFDLLDV